MSRDNSTYQLDDMSLNIISELQQDGRATFREMAQRFGVAPGTVRSRFNQLRDAGIVEVLAVPNPRKLGLRFHATVGLNLEPGSAEEAARILARRREVGWIGLVVSGFDVIFEIAVADTQAYARFKEEVYLEIPGFVSSTVYVMWGVRKFHYGVRPPMGQEGAGEETGAAL
ncbi:MAG: Lrp/AsnC family transcriptional regulator [Gammaproteobacteria bacterium]|nr:Lrp/AsnC family transcriptional regulator [Gammaproteobacteria bacterium]